MQVGFDIRKLVMASLSHCAVFACRSSKVLSHLWVILLDIASSTNPKTSTQQVSPVTSYCRIGPYMRHLSPFLPQLLPQCAQPSFAHDSVVVVDTLATRVLEILRCKSSPGEYLRDGASLVFLSHMGVGPVLFYAAISPVVLATPLVFGQLRSATMRPGPLERFASRLRRQCRACMGPNSQTPILQQVGPDFMANYLDDIADALVTTLQRPSTVPLRVLRVVDGNDLQYQ